MNISIICLYYWACYFFKKVIFSIDVKRFLLTKTILPELRAVFKDQLQMTSHNLVDYKMNWYYYVPFLIQREQMDFLFQYNLNIIRVIKVYCEINRHTSWSTNIKNPVIIMIWSNVMVEIDISIRILITIIKNLTICNR